MRYLEEDQLIEGELYHCETYDGEKLILKYIGYDVFEKLHPILTESRILSIDGDVRYVIKKFEKEK